MTEPERSKPLTFRQRVLLGIALSPGIPGLLTDLMLDLSTGKPVGDGPSAPGSPPSATFSAGDEPDPAPPQRRRQFSIKQASRRTLAWLGTLATLTLAGLIASLLFAHLASR
jgi:hypothetical protein